MANKIAWEGMDELRAVLKRLPRDLADDASEIVVKHAEGARNEIYAAYPARTGNLRGGLSVNPYAASRYGAGAVLRNHAPHAFIFEHGTQARHYFTARGKKKLTGRMPPGNVFIPRVIKWRRRMYEALKALLVQHGLIPSGEEAA